MGDKFVTGILIFSLLASILIPQAISNFNGADQSGWTTQQIALWASVVTFIILGIVWKVLRMAGIVGGRG